MQVNIVIYNNGDGSSSLKFFKETDYWFLRDLDDLTDDYEGWGSGDGVQVTALNFPDNFDLSSLGVDWSDNDIAYLKGV